MNYLHLLSYSLLIVTMRRQKKKKLGTLKTTLNTNLLSNQTNLLLVILSLFFSLFLLSFLPYLLSLFLPFFLLFLSLFSISPFLFLTTSLQISPAKSSSFTNLSMESTPKNSLTSPPLSLPPLNTSKPFKKLVGKQI